MSQENGHHHHDQTPNPDKAAGGNVLKDTVCGMDVDKDSPYHTEQGEEKIYFCSEHCLTKFQENPSAYPIKYEQIARRDEPEVHAPRKETDLYTCPMHPEILQDRPGSCPKCGMALEPKGEAGQEEENPELADMCRRFWVSLVLTLPVFIMAMSDLIPGNPLAGIVSQNVLVWIELVLATPVVFWCGWPFLVRGWQSVVSWNLNMFTRPCAARQ